MLALGLPGCAAKSTYWLAQAESAVNDARNAEAPERAVYHWTMADSFMRKAREEWGYADFGAAETLARRAEQSAREAERVALEVGKTIDLDGENASVPEDVETAPEPDLIDPVERPAIEAPAEDQVEFDLDEDDQEDDFELDEDSSGDSPW